VRNSLKIVVKNKEKLNEERMKETEVKKRGKYKR
jgi:hypothetical protein